MTYQIRETCIFCENTLNNSYFEKDKLCYVGHYGVDLNTNISEMVKIPYNISVCENCNTPQLKYLGDLNDIYKINHADSTGKIMNTLHEKNIKMILKYKKNINNILEIGSSKGVLADLILEQLKTNYFIIEPSYFGNNNNKTIIDDFYENVNDKEIEANTMIISHVFEHFYNPLEILKKIKDNDNIENLFLVFPDLEYYINNNVQHVLNTEHTFYVDNQFLIDVLHNHGFELVDRDDHENHSVLFYFKRNNNLQSKKIISNKNYNLKRFFDGVIGTVNNFNDITSSKKHKNVYLWPASIHTLYLYIFGLNETDIDGFLDNSKNKIGKKMYGTNLEVFDYQEMKKNDNNIVLKNGGVFNKEIQ
jgi:hypothetical protein